MSHSNRLSSFASSITSSVTSSITSSSSARSSRGSRTSFSAALGLATAALALCSASALADTAPATTIAATSAPKLMRAQVQLELLPVGSAEASVDDGPSDSADAATAYGVSVSFDRAVHKYLTVGLSPRVILNVTGEDSPDEAESATELDLRARITAHYPVAPQMEIYGSITPGFSFIMPGDDDEESYSGFAIGAAAGATYDLSPSTFLNAEIGYQRAFTNTDMTVLGQSVDVDVDLSYLHLGLGAGTRF
jgi:hypothetical protein